MLMDTEDAGIGMLCCRAQTGAIALENSQAVLCRIAGKGRMSALGPSILSSGCRLTQMHEARDPGRLFQHCYSAELEAVGGSPVVRGQRSIKR